MMASDLGFGPSPPRIFAVNGWLREAGYLKLRATSVQVKVASHRTLKRLAGPLARRWKRWKGSTGPALVDWGRTSLYGIKYPHARVFGIVVNRAGVKREGWIRDEDVPGLLERVSAELRALRDEQGEPVVSWIKTRDQLGGATGSFPDLLVGTEHPFLPDDGIRAQGRFRPYETLSGVHEPEGLFLVAGPGVDGAGEAEVDIIDIAPTVLGLLGIGIPAHIEGKVRDDLVRLPSFATAPVDVAGPGGARSALSVDETAEIEAHLRTLGYEE
jgi:predicted AlkP superfamily phosphohydrolase/phosphomutase